jgi:psiF repeat-containing protein
MRSILIALCVSVGLVGLGLAPTYGAEKKATNSQQGQQQMMKACTDQANAKNLSGNARKTFINKCVANG